MNITSSPEQSEGIETLALKFSLIQPNVSGLEGKILTIIDASEVGEKRDAIKDLVKQEFRKTLNWFYEVTHTNLSRAHEVYPTWGRPFPEDTVETISAIPEVN